MITIVVVDDMEEIRNYLCEIIGEERERLRVVGVAATGREAVELALEVQPDVVLMDIQMETRTAGIDAIEEILEKLPESKCIVLTIHEDDKYLFRAYMVGASDYIVKTASPERIIRAIYDVQKNQLLLRPDVAQKIIGEYQRIQSTHTRMKEALQVMMKISTAEYEILKLTYYGHTYKSIANQRFVEETTIRSQVNHILKKFGQKRMKDVIAQLRELNIFEE